MSHSFTRQYIHIVFGTKDIKPIIPMETHDSLFAYITGIVKELGGWLLDRSGSLNHVHLLVNAPTDRSISELLCQIKACSTKWYRQTGKVGSTFAWNEGYAAFTVSPDSIDNVKHYFSKEEARHQKCSFETELANFLNVHDIEFKPPFLTKTTYTYLLYHIVFAVKNRGQLLSPMLKSQLHERIRQEVESCGGKIHAIENVADHIHLLVESSRNMITSHLVQKLKTVTTPLICKVQNLRPGDYNWQEGYGVFSVGRPAYDDVSKYVLNQENHHKTCSFENEWDAIVSGNFKKYRI